MNKRKLTVTILAFILFSIHIFGQNTISYTYDSAGNRTGRSASEKHYRITCHIAAKRPNG